jgi:methylase of polypeptide subunit release factors
MKKAFRLQLSLYEYRLDVMHHIYNMLLGGRLYVAPLDRPQRILDIGTGTGIWAIDIADQFPEAEVIGTDLSPIQPKWYVILERTTTIWCPRGPVPNKA